MTERAYIPASAACGQWETLLADALDGLLRPEDEATFAAHMASCPACEAMFEEARKGRAWLEFLAPEPEVPAGLLEKILAEIGPGKTVGPRLAGAAGVVLPLQPAWQRPGLMGFVRRFAEPRLMMTAAMAFFSIALTLNLSGVRLSGLKLADLRPSAIRAFMERRITTASVPIIRYYDHLRFVYEVQSRMRELRRDEGEEDSNSRQNHASPPTPGESRRSPGHKDGGSRVDPVVPLPLQSGKPDALPAGGRMTDFIEASLEFRGIAGACKQFDRGITQDSTTEAEERSTTWTA